MYGVQDFVRFCNHNVISNTEQAIAIQTMQHLFKLNNLSLEKLASLSYTSPATVSRFFNKAGFRNFADFKQKIQESLSALLLNRSLNVREKFPAREISEVKPHVLQDGVNNIQATFDKIDIQGLFWLCNTCRHSRSVAVIGDNHELMDFHTFQLDLIAERIPCLLLNLHELSVSTAAWFSGCDLLILVSLYAGWFHDSERALFEDLHQRGVPIVVFAQEADSFLSFADRVFLYGIEGSLNDGYYSLPFLNRILSNLIHIH